MTLRQRFLIATVSLTIVLVASFSWSAFHTLRTLEHRFFAADFETVFERVVEDFEATGTVPKLNKRGFDTFTGTPPEAPLPALILSDLSPGLHIEFGGGDYNIGRHDVGTTSLFLVQDLAYDPLKITEHELMRIALIAGAASVLAAIALSLWLSRIVLVPVAGLAEAARHLHPGEEAPKLPDVRGSAELEAIGHAFEEAIERFDANARQEKAFTRDASHELRTPLAIIKSSLELLETDEGLRGRHGHRLKRMQTATDQMQVLCEALLSLARSDGGEEGPYEEHEVATLARLSVELYQDAARRRQSRITLAHDGNPLIRAPRGMLVCVVTNLLRNAVEHANASLIHVHVGEGFLAIRDDGSGFALASPEEAFRPAVRGQHSSGEGIGLDLVRRICDHQHWELTLDSHPGIGTRVTLRFAP